MSLNRRIYLTLFFSLFASLTGVGIVVPLLPVYAHGMGAGGFAIGLIFGSFSLSRTFFLPYFGRLSDFKGRKPFIVVGLLGYSLISGAFIWSESVEALIFIRFVQGIASAMIMPVVQAYVGDITPDGSEGLSMGAFNMSVFFGLSAGPLIGGMISDRFSLDAAFGCMGMLTLIGGMLSALVLPPTRSEQAVMRKVPAAPWKKLLRNRNVAALFVFRFAYTACIGVIWSFMPVFADVELSLDSASIGVLVMLGVLVSGLLHAPVGWLADRFNRFRMVVIGGLATSLALSFFAQAQGFGDLLGLILLFGLGGGIGMPPLMAIAVAEGNRSNSMGSVMSLLTMGHSIGMLAGALLAGAMMEYFQLRHAFTLGSAMMLAGTIAFGILSWKRLKAPPA